MVAKVQERLLVMFYELEEWRRDNEAILTGYRITSNSFHACFRSLLYVHNETGNIYSHLVGSLIFLRLAYYSFAEVGLRAWQDHVTFGVFLLCAIACLLFSAVFHLLCCHSQQVSNLWNKCDYLGITLLICGSSASLLYYSFRCDDTLRTVYLLAMALFGFSSFPLIIMARFNTPRYRWFRTMFFISMGLSGVFPVLHGIYLYGVPMVEKTSSLSWLIMMGVVYIVGALLYGARFPERVFPGKFDYLFHSHQIFHLCVVGAALLFYYGLLKAYRWHLSHPCCYDEAGALPWLSLEEEGVLDTTHLWHHTSAYHHDDSDHFFSRLTTCPATNLH